MANEKFKNVSVDTFNQVGLAAALPVMVFYVALTFRRLL